MTDWEMPSGPEALQLLATCAAETERIAGHVRPEQWALPSPCTEWSVRDVLDHMVRANLACAAAFDPDDDPARAAAGDVLGDDPAAALAAANRRLLAQLGRPGAQEQTVTFPDGDYTGRRLTVLRFTDLLSHAWDVARATGQPTDFAPELNASALAISRRRMATLDRAAIGAFGTEQPAPAGASEADRYAAFMGRTV